MSKRSPAKKPSQPPVVSPYFDPNGTYRIVVDKPADVPRIAQTRSYLIPALIAAVIPAIMAATPQNVSAQGQDVIAEQVTRGIKQSFYVTRTRNDRLLWASMAGIPTHWQPPDTTIEPDDLPAALRLVYRLTAALFAAGIRRELNQLHGRYTFKSHQLAIDAAILNAVYCTLLTCPEHLWNVTEPARLSVLLASEHTDHHLPPVAGN